MARVKSEKQALITITSFKEADSVLRDIGDLQMLIRQAETTAKDKIDEIKADMQATVNPLAEQIKNKVTSLEVFCTAHRKEFDGRQSMELNFGIIGWRKSTVTIIKKTTLDLIKKAFSGAKLKQLINIKESVSKEALAGLTEESLAMINARRKRMELFFAEPDLPKAVDYGE